MTNARLKPTLVTARSVRRSRVTASFQRRRERTWNRIAALYRMFPVCPRE